MGKLTEPAVPERYRETIAKARAGGTDPMTRTGAERWHWRNTRSLSVGLRFWLWPWAFGANRDADLYGGDWRLYVGPFEFIVSASIGNCSAEHWWERLGGLSEYEAYANTPAGRSALAQEVQNAE